MFLRRAEHQVFVALVDRVHEQLDAVFLARLDLDHAVEIILGIAPASLHLAFDQLVISGVDVVVQGNGDLLDLEQSGNRH
jgi:hypothetical protein